MVLTIINGNVLPFSVAAAVPVEPQQHLLEITPNAFLLFLVVANVFDQNALKSSTIGTQDVSEELIPDNHHLVGFHFEHLNGHVVAFGTRFAGFFDVERVKILLEALDAGLIVVAQ